ncbi:MAG: hypothetical protein GWN58_23230 [Anaerolineae bacterium]|nr:hypothetical protein [Anaerolineae bacterium]
MGWEDLLTESSGRLAAPWVGGRRVYFGSKAYRVEGKLPREFGLYNWEVTGRRVVVLGQAEPDQDYAEGWTSERGYLVGDRFIHLESGHWELDEFAELSQPTFLVEPGLDRFTLVRIVRDPERRNIYQEELFPIGPEDEVRRAFVDKKESLDDIKGVVPALDMAFRFASWQRQLLEERRAELERRRLEEERLERARQSIGTGLGRRTLAVEDFEAAAKAALSVGGAELLDIRPGRSQNEAVVQYRYEHRRLECVADRRTLRIIDSGICLTDHRTQEKGDTYFTLESLPSVVGEALRGNKLVVYRHVDGDVDDEEYEDW